MIHTVCSFRCTFPILALVASSALAGSDTTPAPKLIAPEPDRAIIEPLPDQGPPNACHDADSNQQWARLLEKNPRDPIIVRLYALRLGLCAMVDQQFIDIDNATKLFEQERVRGLHEVEQIRRNNADTVL